MVEFRKLVQISQLLSSKRIVHKLKRQKNKNKNKNVKIVIIETIKQEFSNFFFIFTYREGFLFDTLHLIFLF